MRAIRAPLSCRPFVGDEDRHLGRSVGDLAQLAAQLGREALVDPPKAARTAAIPSTATVPVSGVSSIYAVVSSVV
jgi:hypothetical protein